MFSKRKYLYSVCEGTTDTIEKIPDEAFSSGMLGVGYSIQPQGEVFFCPVSGKIGNISSTSHAYTITTKDGIDVLVHIGVDTVKLQGSGFKPQVRAGQSVKAGDLLATVDLEKIKKAGLPTITAVLITNPELIQGVEYDFGKTSGAQEAVISYKLKKG